MKCRLCIIAMFTCVTAVVISSQTFDVAEDLGVVSLSKDIQLAGDGHPILSRASHSPSVK